MSGLVRSRLVSDKRIPDPQGLSGEQASKVYVSSTNYAEMPMPATHYATASTELASTDVVPSVIAGVGNASVVDRHDRMNGYHPTAGRQSYPTNVPPMYNSPYSSKFQDWLVGPHINYILNAKLYRCGYPAATVMNGGKRNQALSTRVDQLSTRSTGGPGPAYMRSAPRFGRVQNVPRFSTMPRTYNTQSAPG